MGFLPVLLIIVVAVVLIARHRARSAAGPVVGAAPHAAAGPAMEAVPPMRYQPGFIEPPPPDAVAGSRAGIDYCKLQLERLMVAYGPASPRAPHLLALCRAAEELERIEFEAAEHRPPFANGDPELISYMKENLERGRQVFMSPFGHDHILVLVAKPGRTLF